MIEQLECANCSGNKWYIWGEPFETGGNLVTLTFECSSCEAQMLVPNPVSNEDWVSAVPIDPNPNGSQGRMANG